MKDQKLFFKNRNSLKQISNSIFFIPKITVIFLSFLCSLLVLSGCNKKFPNQNSKVPPSSDLRKIRLSEPARILFYVPQYVAIANEYFKNEGLEIELTVANGSDKAMTSLISGHSDISLFGSEMAIYVANEKKRQTPDSPILFAQLTKKDGSFIVGHDKNFSYDSLKGKKIISGRKGGMPQLVFSAALAKNGISESDVDIITNIRFDLMGASFKEKQSDYVTLFEPTASTICLATGAQVLNSIGEEVGELAYTSYGATDKYIKENSEIIKKFVSALKKGQEWTFAHSPDEIAKVVKSFFPEVENDILISSVENYIKADVWTQTPSINKDSLIAVIELINKFGNKNVNINPDSIIENKFSNLELNNAN